MTASRPQQELIHKQELTEACLSLYFRTEQELLLRLTMVPELWKLAHMLLLQA